MARFIERLDELLEDGTLTQEQYDDLADLSAAKEAIKEHGQVKRERDEFAQKLRSFENQPLREKVFGEVGIDFDNLRPAEKQLIQSFDWEGDEPDKDKAAEFAAQWGLPMSQEATPPGDEGAEGIVNAQQDISRSTPVRKDTDAEYEAAVAGAKTKEELTKVLAAHGRLDEEG